MDVNEFKVQAAIVAFNKLFKNSFFSICDFDHIAKTLNIHPDGKIYPSLRALHCVRYMDMDNALRRALPGMCLRALNMEPIAEIVIRRPILDVAAIETALPVEKKGFLARIFNHG